MRDARCLISLLIHPIVFASPSRNDTGAGSDATDLSRVPSSTLLICSPFFAGAWTASTDDPQTDRSMANSSTTDVSTPVPTLKAPEISEGA